MTIETLTISSAFHGERLWRCAGERDHTTRDGRQIVLTLRETPCVICGAPFQVPTPMGVRSAEQSSSFLTTTCPAHRMTPAESARIARANDRRAVFGFIKQNKLMAGRK